MTVLYSIHMGQKRGVQVGVTGMAPSEAYMKARIGRVLHQHLAVRS